MKRFSLKKARQHDRRNSKAIDDLITKSKTKDVQASITVLGQRIHGTVRNIGEGQAEFVERMPMPDYSHQLEGEPTQREPIRLNLKDGRWSLPGSELTV
jgi:hypothetical protein